MFVVCKTFYSEQSGIPCSVPQTTEAENLKNIQFRILLLDTCLTSHDRLNLYPLA